MGDNDSNDKKNANRHSLNAIKGGFVKDMVNRGFRKKINDSDKNDDSKEDKGGEKPSNVSKDSSSMKAGNVAALRDQFKRAAEKDESKDQNSQAGQSSLTSKAPLGDPRTDQRARAKFLAEKYEKILAARNMVEESASRALQRPATSTPAKIPASVSGVSKEPKDTSEQPRPSKAEPRPSTTPSTSLGPQEPKDTSEQPRPSKAEPRPSTTPSTSLGPQEPKDTSEQPRPSKAEPRPSTTPSTSLGPQEPKDTSEQPRPSKAEPRPSTTPSTSLGPQEPKDTSEQPRPSKAEPRPSTTPSTSLGPQEPKDTSEQPRPSKAEPRPSTTPSTSLGPQEPKDTSEQPRPSKAEPRPSTTPSTSLGPQEPKDTSEQPRPSKAEPRPSTTPSTSLGPQEPKDTSEQPRSSKAESKLSTTLSKLRFSRESRSVIKGTGSFGGSSQVSSNAGRRVHTLADTASTDDASIRQAMSQSFSSPGVSQPEQPERASRGRNMFGMRRRPCWIRIQVKEKIFPGKMILAISTTILIIVVFMFELFINRATFNGRCIGEVDYTHRHEGKAILSYLGYVGCENNLKTTAAERGFLGAGASDKGYPVDYVHKGNLATSLAPPDGPNYRIGTIVGALSANTIRIYGESSRLLTSIFLHGGRWHLLCNCLMNMLLLYVIEPVSGHFCFANHILGLGIQTHISAVYIRWLQCQSGSRQYVSLYPMLGSFWVTV
nr:rhomboid serine protease type 4.5 [Babesia bovis]